MAERPELGMCHYCDRPRPDHTESCPVRQLAEIMAKNHATSGPGHLIITTTDGEITSVTAEP